MNHFVKKLQEELDNSGNMPMFEICVIDKLGNTEFITCDIFFKGNSIIAQRDAVSTEEEKIVSARTDRKQNTKLSTSCSMRLISR